MNGNNTYNMNGSNTQNPYNGMSNTMNNGYNPTPQNYSGQPVNNNYNQVPQNNSTQPVNNSYNQAQPNYNSQSVNNNYNQASQNYNSQVANNGYSQAARPVYNTKNAMNGVESGTYNAQAQMGNSINQPNINTSTNVDPMAAVANLNKEEAMEEALSHTNQYTPFEVPKQEVLENPKQESNKSAYILIAIILVIMGLFIIFLPQISKMFGW